MFVVVNIPNLRANRIKIVCFCVCDFQTLQKWREMVKEFNTGGNERYSAVILNLTVKYIHLNRIGKLSVCPFLFLFFLQDNDDEGNK